MSDIRKNVKKGDKKTLINLLPGIFIPPENYPAKFDKNHIIRPSFIQNQVKIEVEKIEVEKKCFNYVEIISCSF